MPKTKGGFYAVNKGQEPGISPWLTRSLLMSVNKVHDVKSDSVRNINMKCK